MLQDRLGLDKWVDLVFMRFTRDLEETRRSTTRFGYSVLVDLDRQVISVGLGVVDGS